jgi:hypothetical protein
MSKLFILSIGFVVALFALAAQAQTPLPLPMLKAAPPPPANGDSDGLCYMRKGNTVIDLSHLCGSTTPRTTPATQSGSAQPLPVPTAPPLSLPPAEVQGGK